MKWVSERSDAFIMCGNTEVCDMEKVCTADEFNDNIKSYGDAVLRGIQDGLRHPAPWTEDMAMLMTGAFNDAREIFGTKSTAGVEHGA